MRYKYWILGLALVIFLLVALFFTPPRMSYTECNKIARGNIRDSQFRYCVSTFKSRYSNDLDNAEVMLYVGIAFNDPAMATIVNSSFVENRTGDLANITVTYLCKFTEKRETLQFLENVANKEGDFLTWQIIIGLKKNNLKSAKHLALIIKKKIEADGGYVSFDRPETWLRVLDEILTS